MGDLDRMLHKLKAILWKKSNWIFATPSIGSETNTKYVCVNKSLLPYVFIHLRLYVLKVGPRVLKSPEKSNFAYFERSLKM